MLAVAVVAVAVVAGAFGLRGGNADTAAPAPAGPVDLQAEDAVVAMLGIYQAERAAATAARTPQDVFAMPGALDRADRLDTSASRLETALEQGRFAPVAEPSVAAAYILHAEHESLVALLRALAGRARALGLLRDVHATLYGGAGARIDEQVITSLDEIAGGAAEPATAAWAAALRDALVDPEANAPRAADGLVAARDAWAADASGVDARAVDLLRQHLAGVDPAVLAALDGHPVAGPALRELR